MEKLDELSRYYVYKTKKGLENRLSKLSYEVDRKLYFDRLEYENSVIIQMGYPGYFLVVQDFINWAKDQGILVGPGRGSGAGALACFALGITNVDPLPYNLIFERFLNPARVSMPDLDIDFPKSSRDLVIQYVRDKYGEDKVAQIGTFGTYKAKAAIKAVCRTLGYPVDMAKEITELYPKPIAGKESKLKDALQSVPKLAQWYASKTDKGEVLRWAEKMENRVSSFGIHASGVVIGNEPLHETVPLALGKRGEIVTQWEMNSVEEAGLIKFDFLGLKNLDTIQIALVHIKERHGIEIDIENIPLDDAEVYANLRKGDNIGVFQLESSSGMRDLLVKIRPTSIEDITALVAMFRPGPLASPKMAEYLAWRAGEAQPSYHHPDLEPILAPTGGWIVYQEQVLQIARDLAGYDLAGADLLRRAVGKKKEKEMAEHMGRFFKGMKDNGYTGQLAAILWDEIQAFADYGFNKSHAIAYAVISYWCSYLKTHYPKEFMAAALTCDTGNMDQMIVYLQECKRIGIDVLPPDINESQLDFAPTNDGIRFGFSAIKNLGAVPAQHILDNRNRAGRFRDIFEFSQRVDLGVINRKKLESLCLSGAFDSTGRKRSVLLQGVEEILLHKTEVKRYEKKLETYAKKCEAVLERLDAIERGELSDKGKKLRPLKEPDKPEQPPAPEFVDLPELPKQMMLTKEKELTGFFISGHPLDRMRTGATTIRSLRDDKPDHIILNCVLSKVEIKESKKKQRYAYLRFEDLTGTVEGVAWPWIYEKAYKELIPNIPIMIQAKVEYTEAETDHNSEQDEVIPYLHIKGVQLLGSQVSESEDINVEVPLDISKLAKIKKILTKHEGTDAAATIKFKTSSGDTLATSKVFGIQKNGRTIRSEILRAAK